MIAFISFSIFNEYEKEEETMTENIEVLYKAVYGSGAAGAQFMWIQ